MQTNQNEGRHPHDRSEAEPVPLAKAADANAKQNRIADQNEERERKPEAEIGFQEEIVCALPDASDIPAFSVTIGGKDVLKRTEARAEHWMILDGLNRRAK